MPKIKKVNLKDAPRVDFDGNDNPDGLFVDYAYLKACPDVQNCEECKAELKERFIAVCERNGVLHLSIEDVKQIIDNMPSKKEKEDGDDKTG